MVTRVASVFASMFSFASGEPRGTEFGSNYVWVQSLEDGFKLATTHKKPIMLVIHKTWCPACRSLRVKFENSTELQQLSKRFVMVNLCDDKEPKSARFAPDGSYVPRILFLSPKGSVEDSIYNEKWDGQHKYYYWDPDQIARAMKKALRVFDA